MLPICSHWDFLPSCGSNPLATCSRTSRLDTSLGSDIGLLFGFISTSGALHGRASRDALSSAQLLISWGFTFSRFGQYLSATSSRYSFHKKQLDSYLTYPKGVVPRRSFNNKSQGSWSSNIDINSKFGVEVQQASWSGVLPKSSQTWTEHPASKNTWSITWLLRRQTKWTTDSPNLLHALGLKPDSNKNVLTFWKLDERMASVKANP